MASLAAAAPPFKAAALAKGLGGELPGTSAGKAGCQGAGAAAPDPPPTVLPHGSCCCCCCCCCCCNCCKCCGCCGGSCSDADRLPPLLESPGTVPAMLLLAPPLCCSGCPARLPWLESRLPCWKGVPPAGMPLRSSCCCSSSANGSPPPPSAPTGTPAGGGGGGEAGAAGLLNPGAVCRRCAPLPLLLSERAWLTEASA